MSRMTKEEYERHAAAQAETIAALRSQVKALTGAVEKARDNAFQDLRDMIGLDGHQWSKRPCPTCQAITDKFRRMFGCILYAHDLAAQKSALPATVEGVAGEKPCDPLWECQHKPHCASGSFDAQPQDAAREDAA